MNLCEVIDGIDVICLSGPANPGILALAYDSRRAASGGLFFALPGAKADGARFAIDAISHGATAVASSRARPLDIADHVTWIELRPGRERQSLARAGANFYGHPASTLQLVGITGTNGKTTTAYLIDAVLTAGGYTAGLLGTTGHRTPQGSRAGGNTTPESLDLQQMFAEVQAAGGTHVVLEASSHALSMDRLWGCHFEVAIFTNLTRDHLDYHETFENYFTAKRQLFEGTGAGAPATSLINSDDPYASRLEGLAARTLTYGLKGSPDITTKKFSLSFGGLEFTAQTPIGKLDVRSGLVGRINVYNILAAIGAGVALGVPIGKIEQGIASLNFVPGRFERIDEGQPFLVVVDYAHTDDALRNLISTARELSSSARIITVFGAGGDRDRTKRPLMGEAAGSLSDLVVLTSDNPRDEDPLRIINDVVVGLQKANAKYRIEPDREQALWAAIEQAQAGDIVLLAGKGHETSQVLKNQTIAFDDRGKAREILRSRGFSKNPAKR